MTTTQGDGMEEKLIEMEYDSAKEKMFAIEKEHGIERLPKRVEPPEPHNCSQEEIEAKRRFWRDKLKELNITKIVAPMVDQSELPFRMMMRKHGAQLTFTPMIHAHLFVSNGTYRRHSLSYFHEDRPLIVQFCANKPETFLAACRLVEGVCDGVDLNLGCPQMVAKRGHYGAFLQDEVDLICSMVSGVRDHCKLPVSCKIRIRDDPKQTIEYACRLVQAGASMLTVHGRTREMKGQNTGLADWSRIKQVIDAVDVPVLANGNIQMPGDVERCIAATGCAGVMSAEGILSNPYLFEDRTEDAWKVAKEYLEFVKQYPPILSEARSHIFRICHHAVMESFELRDKLVRSHTLPEFEETIDELRKMTEAIMETEEGRQRRREADEMFRQIRGGEIVMDPVAVCRLAHWIVRPYMRPKEVPRELVVKQGEATYRNQRKNELKAMAKDAGVSIRSIKKREKRKMLRERVTQIKKKKLPPCERCKQPAGQNCQRDMCKKCCKFVCKTEYLDCPAHNSRYSHLLKEGDGEKNENGNNHHQGSTHLLIDKMQRALTMEEEIQASLNPTCTGTSVFAVMYDKGVVIASDRVVSYGKSTRYKNFTRQYKVNNEILIAFSGDHADFQYVQSVIEKQVLMWKQVNQVLSPHALHSFLTNLFYNKRSRMNPLWNNLIVAGIETESDNKPFIGVITQRGVAYTVKHVANGMGSFLLNQVIETEWRKKSGATTRQEAEAIVRKAVELAIYHDCVADNDFEVNYVDADDGVRLGKEETVIGDWALAETNCQYE